MTSTPPEYRKTGFWEIALSPSVVKRALRVALLVGVILALINHGDAVVTGQINLEIVLKILLTFCVPYSVSTYSSVRAVREFSNK